MSSEIVESLKRIERLIERFLVSADEDAKTLVSETVKSNQLLELLCRTEPEHRRPKMCPRELAAAALIEDGGRTLTTYAAVARKIGASQSTVRKWPEIRAAINEIKQGRRR